MEVDYEPRLQAVRSNLKNVKLKEVVSEEQDVLMLEHNLSVGEALRVRCSHSSLSTVPMAVLRLHQC